ncbi:MAG: NAD+ synthase [Rhodospirillales bacterium]|nr:NAD+ synthase [Rhodospirillales bacterium]MDH3969226.1 NAD+ synthase [Rhodospirillales bacterium]
MSDRLTIALAQLNPTMGAIEANADLIRAARATAASQGADLVVGTELCITGYPPEDLVLKPSFLAASRAAVEALAAETADGGPALLVSAPWREEGIEGGPLRQHVYDAALLLDGGEIQALRFKHDLPNYSVFDEKRVFKAGPLPGPVNFRGVRLGVMICEDMWAPDVAECLEESGAEILIVPNGSPYEMDKFDQRLQLAVARVTETSLPLVYVNQVGGQDELVFDGASFVLDAGCRLRAQLPSFETALVTTHWRRGLEDVWTCEDAAVSPPETGLEPVYRALVLGLRDYVDKNGFPGVVLGLSGGIDSALSAAIAVDALGPARVNCVMMPSPYTSRDSLEDAAEAARLLGVRLDKVGIEPAMAAFETMLRPMFDGREADITEENVQARSRGVTLMALSNKLGHMVLSTGNKSEMSVGYATLYGDMCGGFNVLKDVYKTMVYRLAGWRNQALPKGALGPSGRAIPERSITKAPSAELKPDQTDQDSLPPYDALDDMLHCLIEGEMAVSEIAERGYDRATVNRVWRLLENAEYKRRQAAPGVKVTARAFGRDRRYPITNAFKGPR